MAAHQSLIMGETIDEVRNRESELHGSKALICTLA
jgi:hypothetical protein